MPDSVEETDTSARLARAVPKAKQTIPGLYISAKDAYSAWKASPDKITILDVRTIEELLFVGHPTMAWKVPAFGQTYEWDAEKGQFPMRPLPDFVDRVRRIAMNTQTIMAMCRSGGRSAIAVNLLAEARFTRVFQIVDGFEGDVVDDPASIFTGWRLKNGWKNSLCPWTYRLSPERTLLPGKDPSDLARETQ